MSGPLLGVAGIAVMFAVLFLLRIPAAPVLDGTAERAV